MQVTSYGLFWRAAEIEWFPGKGRRNEFRLLGRIGKNRPGIRVADFRRQQGIYILFDEYGPAYVGLAKGDRLGARLRDHHGDHLVGKWDRFSWFGFNPVGATPDRGGVLSLNQPRRDVTDDTSTTIGDLEALLIAAWDQNSISRKCASTTPSDGIRWAIGSGTRHTEHASCLKLDRDVLS